MGFIKVENLIKKALEINLNSLAFIGKNNLYGAAAFYFKCTDAKIKPIIGCEIDVFSGEFSDDSRRTFPLILLAQDNLGYRNLVKLISLPEIAHNRRHGGFRLSRLEQFRNGLIALTSFSETINMNISDRKGLITDSVLELADIFSDRLYIEIERLGRKHEECMNKILLDIAEGLDIPIVATNDCIFLEKEDASFIGTIMKKQKQLNRGEHIEFTKEQYFKLPEDMQSIFIDLPEAFMHACKITECCNVELDTGVKSLPVAAVFNKNNLISELAKLVTNGLAVRINDRSSKDISIYQKRIAYELDIIKKTGFAEYFLAVYEFVTWAKRKEIPVGPGRGSVVNSLVAWALGITQIDPILYDLPFDRFLNFERATPPDIDIDVSSRRRAEVIGHLADIYGHSCVAKVISFSRIGPKGAIRKAGDWLGMSESEINPILNFLPDKKPLPICVSLHQSALQTQYRTNERIRRLLDLAIRLEGVVNCVSSHASAVVMSQAALIGQIPICIGKNGERLTQYECDGLEQLGFTKIDILGLKTLDFIDDILNIIKSKGLQVPDLAKLSLNDEVTYKLYASGDLKGVFHMTSPAIRSYMMELKPDNFNDLVLMLALNRPGPLANGMMAEFIRRRRGNSKVTYPHELLADCLKDTYGLIAYQEQVMQTSRLIAGYSLGEADLLRRAICKKTVDKMASEKSRFMEGATKNGIAHNQAEHIFNQLEKFAGYGLSKGHAVAYAHISWQTAWLKTHFPAEFYSCL